MKPKHKTSSRPLIKLPAACLTALALLMVSSANATNYTWTQNSVATQTWTTPGNWDANGVFATGSGNNLTFFADTTTALANGTNGITTSVPTTLTMNVLTLNGLGATATATSAITIASSSSTWTLDGTTPTVNLNGLNGSQALNYTIAAKLALAQTDTLFTGSGTASFNFSGIISGTGKSITKTGTSALTLSSVNTFDGGIKLKAGAVKINTSDAALGTGAFQIGDTTGTTAVTVDSLSARSITNALNIYQDFTYSGTSTLAHGTGAITLFTNGTTGNRQITVSGSTLTLGGIIGDGGNNYGITKVGGGTLTLSGANTYAGGTTISGGALSFLKTTAKAATGTHAFAAGTTLGLGVSGSNAFTSTDIDNAFAGNMTGNLAGITVTATTAVGIDTTNGDFTYNTSSITGSKSLVNLGTNILTLSGSSSFTGGWL